jgi:hypothetical protein
MHRFQPMLGVIAIALSFTAAAAQAQSQVVGRHPAVAAAAQIGSAIDPNQFLVQPPASVQWAHAHTNGEHPAVLVSGRPAARAVDANQFIVQPPAAVRWTPAPLLALDVAEILERAAALR